jgi:Glycosyltransferase like family 2
MTSGPAISVVVVAYDMARELPRSLRALARPYQRGLADGDVEVIVVDNGSPVPLVPPADLDVAWTRLDPAPPSPVRAANEGIRQAAGDLIGLVVDGARLASPGLLATALAASRIAERTIVTAPAYHLGSTTHMDSAGQGYDQAEEDRLLEASGWEADGYELFSISTLAASSGRGWFGPMGESSSLFMRRALWDELGGLDERFALPGGGLANHDLYRRACEAPGTTLVVLPGEGTFHQVHGGAATSRRFDWEQMHADYVAIRDQPYRPPENRPIYFGMIPPQALPHAARSAELALERQARAGRRSADRG